MVAVLFPVLESPELVILVVKLALRHPAAGRGFRGILKPSVPDGAIDPDFVQVTVIPTAALQDQPLSLKGEVGPVKFAGIVNTLVVVPIESVFPALVIRIGRRDV